MKTANLDVVKLHTDFDDEEELRRLDAQEAIERFLNDEISLGELEDALGARRP